MAWSVNVYCTRVKELSSPPQHTYLRGEKKKLVFGMVSCTVMPTLGRQAQEDPWNSLASSLTESVSFRFNECTV